MIISLPEETGKPYTANGRSYKRVGTTTQLMSQAEYESLLLERNRHLLCWDMEINKDVSISEIDEDLLRMFIKTTQRTRNLGISENLPVEELLTGLQMMKGKKPLNAAVALFGKKPERYFVQLAVKAARFKGITKDEFIDNQLFKGNLFELYEKTQGFLSSHIRIAGKVPSSLGLRKDIPEYPLEALREGLLNALIHRDYYNPSGGTEVAIYDDRIEIWNNGHLPSGFTVETLYHPHRSAPRNPLLAQAFFLYGAIEAWGRGTLKIIELCEEGGLPTPQFNENSGGLEVRFLSGKKIVKPERAVKLSEVQQKIIAYITKHGEASTNELVDHLGISRTAVQNNIKKMTKIIKWTGKSAQDPHGKYVLKQ